MLLHTPSNPSGFGLVLTHGAGANAEAPLLVHLATAFAAAGWFVLRYTLPFRQRRPFGPPSPSTAAEDRAGLHAAVQQLRQSADRICLGGHSYGGRQASMLGAEIPNLVEALLLLSYPLHPPKKPGQLRTAHFPQLHTPAFFVSGVKDEFATIEELHAAVELIPARTAIQTIDGAGHDLKKGAAAVTEQVVQQFMRFVTPG
jgi:predicted alpha/beta-hydrolase family hydrolase